MNFQQIVLPYGSGSIRLDVPPGLRVDVIAPGLVPASTDPLGLVNAALNSPVNNYHLEQFHGARSAAIAINDKTRPVPHAYLLPPLLERLQQMGIARDRIQLIVATGTHVPTPESEFPSIYPTHILQDYRVTSHDCDDEANLVPLGVTSRNTPVAVNRRFYEADLRIVTGSIVPHHFMGFSGGVKSAAIGLTARRTINTNHAMLVDPLAAVGLYDENPMRLDIEEIGRMIGVHFALNTIQNDELELFHALSGEPQSVMRAAIPLSRQACQVSVMGQYDLVIASAGGYPKDINLYQAQKALTHAALITRGGGTVILVAECREGSGSRSCEEFLEDVHTYQEALVKFQQQGFRVGPHKAFQIAREAGRIRLGLVSQLPDDLASQFFFTPVHLEEGLLPVFQQLPAGARVAILPSATHTIPAVQKQS